MDQICCRPEFASLPPSQTVPILAVQNEYLARESSLYRRLRARGLPQYRCRAARPSRREAQLHRTKGPHEIRVGDITRLPGLVACSYLMRDLISRKVVGWEVIEEETAVCAAIVVSKASLDKGRGLAPLVLRSDNSSPMKGATMLVILLKLGIAASFSRPDVSDVNAQAEAFIRTLKYRLGYPGKGFGTLEGARDWVKNFVHWHHRHFALKLVATA